MGNDKDKIARIEGRLERRGEALRQLQLISNAFSSLGLEEESAVADTLGSMICAFTESQRGATLLDMGEVFAVAGQQGFTDLESLLAPEAAAVWRWVMDERVARVVSAEEIAERWPGCPADLAEGFAAVSIAVRDKAEGLIVVGHKLSGRQYSDEELEFLSAASAIGAMAFSNARSIAAQRDLVRDVERKAREAQEESEQKARALAELDQKLEIIERQRSAIQELSTPILELWDDVLALPVIGVVDTRRSMEIMERLLNEVTEKQARFVILDITGVEVVDTKTADHFIKVIRAAELLGTKCILTGIRPAVAQTLVEIGVDLESFSTLRNLRQGLQECLRHMNRQGSHADLVA
jgi:rsbT co-antagonist protein RsbR